MIALKTAAVHPRVAARAARAAAGVAPRPRRLAAPTLLGHSEPAPGGPRPSTAAEALREALRSIACVPLDEGEAARARLLGVPAAWVLDAADRELAAREGDVIARGRVIRAVCETRGAEAAAWLQPHLAGGLHRADAIAAAAAALPRREALAHALEAFDVRCHPPDWLWPVRGPEVLDWLESQAPRPFAPWLDLVASCAPSWARLRAWIGRGRPHSTMAAGVLTDLLARRDRAGRARVRLGWNWSEVTVDVPAPDELRAAMAGAVTDPHVSERLNRVWDALPAG